MQLCSYALQTKHLFRAVTRPPMMSIKSHDAQIWRKLFLPHHQDRPLQPSRMMSASETVHLAGAMEEVQDRMVKERILHHTRQITAARQLRQIPKIRCFNQCQQITLKKGSIFTVQRLKTGLREYLAQHKRTTRPQRSVIITAQRSRPHLKVHHSIRRQSRISLSAKSEYQISVLTSMLCRER